MAWLAGVSRGNGRHANRHRARCAAALVLFIFARPALGGSEKEPEDDAGRSEVQRYCSGAAPSVVDARTMWEVAQLSGAEKRIAEKTALLEKRLAQFEEWSAKRDDFLKRAEDSTVAIFAKMKPESAAAQFATMDERDAAAFIAKLPARSASLVLAEMEAGRAARLARLAASNGFANTGADR